MIQKTQRRVLRIKFKTLNDFIYENVLFFNFVLKVYKINIIGQ